ncbi:S8 family serine peptidase [Streptomyces thermolineatus]|uniref:S8 family serine peptidase n=1 Tax=Streptomyces thermolineatus TaxID=44033 RepID=UPI00384A6CDC
MTESIPSRRRTARVALAAGMVAALTTSGIAVAFAAPAQEAPQDGPVKAAAEDKLGQHDADLLAEAKENGDKHVTFMVATDKGAAKSVAGELDALSGASVGKVDNDLGYVRVTVATGKADKAIAAAVKNKSVSAIDLNEEIELPDPDPAADRAKDAKTSASAGEYAAPGKDTPAENPYQPSFETGAVDFVEDHPKADGRGVTIGILDSGVDLGHPALQKTTTGERKIVDWVTATDPIVDGDGTWRPMITSVEGGTFTYNSREYTAPEGDYSVSLFRESATLGGEMEGDLNRDGDTTDSWALLYDAAAGTVRVDLDDDGDLAEEPAMKPYKDGFQIGHFGTDDPSTDIAESIPFVVEVRKNVPMDPYGGDWVGKKVDFVNIGVVEGSHGSHVAGITAANGLFGGGMNGAAPGAKLVSSRACTWSGGCTSTALTEGMIDLVANRGVDIVNMSIGGLPALNDGNNARAQLYTRLIDKYGVQLVISAGNSGPGTNTIGDPSLADKVISVGASVSKETWAANYGSAVSEEYSMFPFSSRGPREDGGATPVLAAPGASINTVPTWQPGQPVAEAGYSLPAGYGMLQGTSMASPQAAGAAALLISAAKAEKVALTPATLRTALVSTAEEIDNYQAHEQGAGLMNIVKAWKLLKKGSVSDRTYSVSAPVNTALSQFLATPHTGAGLYDRGGLKANKAKTYTVTVTRTSGPDKAVTHYLSLANGDGAFKLGASSVALPLNQPVKIKVTAKADYGVHSALINVDDPATRGVDKQVMATAVVAKDLAAPSFSTTEKGVTERNGTDSYFVTVPEGAKSLEIQMSGLLPKSQTRFIALNPYGVPVDPTSTINCYPNYTNPNNKCRPDLRSYTDPMPGVWEIEVESRRTSGLLENPYTVTATALGATFDPAVKTVPDAEVGKATPVEWTVTNGFAAVDGKLAGGSLGSAFTGRPTIANGEEKTTEIVVGEGVSRLDVAIGSTADTGADLDLSVSLNGKVVASSADGDSEESVSIANPAAGTYTVTVDGYSVPAGTTEYDYRDVYYSAGLGSVKVDEGKQITLANGATATVTAEVVPAAAAPEGRRFFGEVKLLNSRGTLVGSGSVVITGTTG